MAEWMKRLVPFFASIPRCSGWYASIRLKPGQWGPSVAEIFRKAMPSLPSHIRLIGSAEEVNTYDLMDITEKLLALVYTTTAGLELALIGGIPVLISGRAHCRKKGFTLDADTWDEYFGPCWRQALADLPGQPT